LCEDEGFARADGNLSNENLESELFQHGSSMIMVPYAGATAEEHQIRLLAEGFCKRLCETLSIIADPTMPNWIRRIGEEKRANHNGVTVSDLSRLWRS
jgi:hypothetical protein